MGKHSSRPPHGLRSVEVAWLENSVHALDAPRWIPAGSVEWDTALSITVMALLGSTVFSFILSAALSGKIFRPVDIQNATLAGGVAIGATANLNVTPVGALLIGAAGGLVSTLGYVYVQP